MSTRHNYLVLYKRMRVLFDWIIECFYGCLLWRITPGFILLFFSFLNESYEELTQFSASWEKLGIELVFYQGCKRGNKSAGVSVIYLNWLVDLLGISKWLFGRHLVKHRTNAEGAQRGSLVHLSSTLPTSFPRRWI